MSSPARRRPELLRRGHEVRMAVPPDLVEFGVEVSWACGARYGLIRGVAGGAPPTSRRVYCMISGRSTIWRRLWREVREPMPSAGKRSAHRSCRLADGADLLFTGLSFEQPAANVAEY